MSRPKLFSQDYFRLFLRREGRFMFGKRFSTLWIITAMLTTMLLALSFSNASIKYLQYKMDDPFIHWLDIKNQGYGSVFNALEEVLEDPEVMSEYHYSSIRQDYQFSFFFYEQASDAKHYISCRLFENYDSPIFKAILAPDNVIQGAAMGAEELSGQASIGVIVTQNVLDLLNYDEPPHYIMLSADCSVTGETAGLEVIGDYAKVPIPVLGVVKRLPGNVDMVSTAFLYSGINAFTFDLGAPDNEDYASSLIFYVPDQVDLDSFPTQPCPVPALTSFAGGSIRQIDTEDMDLEEVVEIAGQIAADYASKGVVRLFDYHLEDYMDLPEFPAYLSVQFDDLKRIADFSEFVSDQTEEMDPERRVAVDITASSAKENFNAVSTMASILSWALIVFSITSIILFIVNLLQAYFSKVKRNLGTFKAFGMGNKELTSIYLVIIMAAILLSMGISVLLVAAVQWILSLTGTVHEAGYPFISLLSGKTFAALLAVLVAVFITVRLLLGKLLQATPGDLIYDRK